MSLRDRDYNEKRDFIRMRIEAGVTLVIGDTEVPGTCLDLSSTGMQVEAATQLEVGARVRVRIATEHASLKGLDAEAEVLRVAALEDGRQRLGLAILNME